MISFMLYEILLVDAGLRETVSFTVFHKRHYTSDPRENKLIREGRDDSSHSGQLMCVSFRHFSLDEVASQGP